MEFKFKFINSKTGIEHAVTVETSYDDDQFGNLLFRYFVTVRKQNGCPVHAEFFEFDKRDVEKEFPENIDLARTTLAKYMRQLKGRVPYKEPSKFRNLKGQHVWKDGRRR